MNSQQQVQPARFTGQPQRASLQVAKTYQGHFSHSAFGAQRHDVRVMLLTATTGQMYALGQSTDVIVTYDGDRIVLDDGMTQLDGIVDSQGVIKGEMIQDGIRGGNFLLNPIRTSPASYVAPPSSFVAPPMDIPRGDSLVMPATPSAQPRVMSMNMKSEASSGQQSAWQPLRTTYKAPPLQSPAMFPPMGNQPMQRPRSYVPPVLPNTVPTIAGVEHISPEAVYDLMRGGQCILVDVRGEDRASGLIEGSTHVQASIKDKSPWKTKVPDLVQRFANSSFVVFTCQYSAHRAPQCANWYREQAPPHQRVGILEGGFRNWEGKGLPVVSAGSSPGLLMAGGGSDRGEDFSRNDFSTNLGLQYVKHAAPQVFAQISQTPMPWAPPPPPVQLTAQQIQRQASPPAAAPPPQGGQARRYVPPRPLTAVPTSEGVESIEPEMVHDLLANRRCVLIDLRGDDRAAGIIDGAVHVPAIDKDLVPFPMKVPNLVLRYGAEELVVFTCQYSVHRAPQCANWYREKTSAQQRVGILAGGFRGWEAKGLPVSPLNGATAEEASAADERAMQTGVRFVQRFAPAVYDRAQQDMQQMRPPPPPPPPPPAAPPSLVLAPAAASPSLALAPPAPRPLGVRHSSPTPQQQQMQSIKQVPNSISITYVPPRPATTVPTINGVEHMAPEVVYKALQNRECVLVDLRGQDRAAGLIDGADHVPAIDKAIPFTQKVPDLVRRYANESLVIFTCQYSIHRAPQCANWYREKAPAGQRVAILAGGFRGWEAQGFPVAFTAVNAQDATAADDYAMQQGVQFVKQYVPKVYEEAQRVILTQQQPQEPPAFQPPPRPSSVEFSQGNQAPYTTPTGSQQADSGFGSLENLEPEVVNNLLREGRCVLVDVRDADRASGLIEGAHHVPAIDKVTFASRVPSLVQQYADVPVVVFMCQYSRHRAPRCATLYCDHASPNQKVAILVGGFRGWEGRGLPVVKTSNVPEDKNSEPLNEQQAPNPPSKQRSSKGTENTRRSPSQALKSRDSDSRQMERQQRHQPSPQPQRSQPSPQPQRLQQSSSPPSQPQPPQPPQPQLSQTHLQQTQGQMAPQSPATDGPYQSPAQVGSMQLSPDVTATSGNTTIMQPANLPLPQAEGVDRVEPEVVHELLSNGLCLLVDVRDDDRAAGLIDGAVHVPAIADVPFPDKVPELVKQFAGVRSVIFTCQYSRHRAPQCAGWYRDQADPNQHVGILTGGFRGWEAKGLPVLDPAQSAKESNQADETALRHGHRFVQQYGRSH